LDVTQAATNCNPRNPSATPGSRAHSAGGWVPSRCSRLRPVASSVHRLLPLYLMMDTLRLTNNIIALAIGITVLNLPFVIWILKPFFDSLPREIEEAAQLDGLGPAGIFWRFAITLAGPGFKTVALFSFITAWTDLLIPITMSTKPEGWALTAGIVQMQTGFKIYWGALMAGGLYLPSFVIAIAMQKSLTRGLRTTF
jgi:ABC-type glycerol-3-phosphate transport system permease component